MLAALCFPRTQLNLRGMWRFSTCKPIKSSLASKVFVPEHVPGREREIRTKGGYSAEEKGEKRKKCGIKPTLYTSSP